jgi:hypothetical protein
VSVHAKALVAVHFPQLHSEFGLHDCWHKAQISPRLAFSATLYNSLAQARIELLFFLTLY